jgi:hypothetical protein
LSRIKIKYIEKKLKTIAGNVKKPKKNIQRFRNVDILDILDSSNIFRKLSHVGTWTASWTNLDSK